MTQPAAAPPPGNAPPRQGILREAGVFVAAAALLAVTVIVGYYTGALLDSWLDTGPWLTVAFILLGLTAGLFEVAHMVAPDQANRVKPG